MRATGSLRAGLEGMGLERVDGEIIPKHNKGTASKSQSDLDYTHYRPHRNRGGLKAGAPYAYGRCLLIKERTLGGTTTKVPLVRIEKSGLSNKGK